MTGNFPHAQIVLVGFCFYKTRKSCAAIWMLRMRRTFDILVAASVPSQRLYFVESVFFADIAFGIHSFTSSLFADTLER